MSLTVCANSVAAQPLLLATAVVALGLKLKEVNESAGVGDDESAFLCIVTTSCLNRIQMQYLLSFHWLG